MTRTRLRVFPAIARNSNATQHIDDLMRVARFAEANGLDGPLLFAGNDTPVEPWAMAQHILANTARISPLIAVNPVYMHPFTVAKFVSSFALLHHRKIFLNMITGTATSDLTGLGERRSRGERYSRLGEFILIVRQLLASTRPVTFRGEFYATEALQLRPSFPPALMPEFLIAGQSDDARRVATQTGCLRMQMLPPDLEQGIDAPGLNFGIFAREGRDQARQEAKRLFPDSAEKRELMNYTMENTESVWKRRLYEAGQDGELRDNGFWLLPFLTYQADCPYLVGSYSEIGATLRRFADRKIGTIILDVVADARELDHVCKALASSGAF
jgi:alkanesulfonate monooxygenase